MVIWWRDIFKEEELKTIEKNKEKNKEKSESQSIKAESIIKNVFQKPF